MRKLQQASVQTIRIAFADWGYTGQEPARTALDKGVDL